VGAAIVRRQDLEVLNSGTSIAVVVLDEHRNCVVIAASADDSRRPLQSRRRDDQDDHYHLDGRFGLGETVDTRPSAHHPERCDGSSAAGDQALDARQ
jgi:hypothetical protein